MIISRNFRICAKFELFISYLDPFVLSRGNLDTNQMEFMQCGGNSSGVCRKRTSMQSECGLWSDLFLL